MIEDNPPFFSRVSQIEISEDNEEQRIDNFLVSRLKGVPKSRIYRILRKGEVRVNKGRVKPAYRLQKGDIVRIPPIRVSGTGEAPEKPHPEMVKRLQEAILYESRELLILNKPSGIAVHGGSGVSQGVIETLRAALPETRFLELVHRLDRDTSGCLLIAKKRSALRILHELLRKNGIDKRYLALVKGEWRGGEQRVAVPLRKNQLSSGERIVRVDPQGKSAVTLFKPICQYQQATLVEVRLITGRTHQVRVHAAHIGHPVAGDEKYGDSFFNKTMRAAGLSRLFLHARSLDFQLAPDAAPVQVTAPLEKKLQVLLSRLDSGAK